MGVIIVDGRTFLRYKGSANGLIRVLKEFEAINRKGNIFSIETVPIPEMPLMPFPDVQKAFIGIEVRVKGISISDFGKVITNFERAIQKLKEMGLLVDLVSRLPIPLPKPGEEWLEGSGWTIIVRLE